MTRYVQCPTANYISETNTQCQLDTDEYEFSFRSNLQTIGVVTLRKLIHEFFPNKRFYKRALKTQTWWKEYKNDTNVFYQCLNNSY